MKIALILAAAGCGSRMGVGENKVLLPLGGRPLLEWSLLLFQNTPQVERILVTTASQDQEAIQSLLAPYPKACLVPGGATRMESVSLALNQLLSSAPAGAGLPWDKVAIHDGARPLLSTGDWQRLLNAAKTAPGALLVRPVTDTIKMTYQGQVLSTVPRERLAAAETPQIFDLTVLADAYRYAKGKAFRATDDAGLVEKMGVYPLAVVAQDPNPKITYLQDLAIAEVLLQQRSCQ